MANDQAPIFKTPGIGLAVGILVGMGTVVILLLTNFGRTEPDTSKLATPTAAANFSKAWQAMYQSTWLQTKSYTRTANGRSTSSTGIEARRLPDLVQIASGNITTIRDNKRTICALGIDCAKGTCQPSTTADAVATAAQEVAATRDLTAGANALYGVSQRGDACFYLELTTLGLSKNELDQPWGTRSSFCFDDKTHALLSAKLERGDAVDVVVSKYLVGQVTDNDLDRLSRGDTSFLPE